MFRIAQVFLLSPWLLLAAALSSGNINCTSGVHVILARGTGEPQNSSLAGIVSRAIVAAIPGSTADEVIYPANATFNVSVAEGVTNANLQISDYVAACPVSPIVLMGYSQGAQVIGNVLGGGGTSIFGQTTPPNAPLCPSLGSHIIAVVLFGDPNRNENIGTNADVSGPACNVSSAYPRTGYNAGNITHYADRLSEWCQYSDFVCCSTGTTFAGHLSYYTDENADAIAQYVADKASHASIPAWTPQTQCDLSSSSRPSASPVGNATEPGSTGPSGTMNPTTSVSQTTSTRGTVTATPFAGSASRSGLNLDKGIASAFIGLVLMMNVADLETLV